MAIWLPIVILLACALIAGLATVYVCSNNHARRIRAYRLIKLLIDRL
jgi:hypothetical protein